MQSDESGEGAHTAGPVVARQHVGPPSPGGAVVPAAADVLSRGPDARSVVPGTADAGAVVPRLGLVDAPALLDAALGAHRLSPLRLGPALRLGAAGIQVLAAVAVVEIGNVHRFRADHRILTRLAAAAMLENASRGPFRRNIGQRVGPLQLLHVGRCGQIAARALVFAAG